MLTLHPLFPIYYTFRIKLFDWNSVCTSYDSNNRTISLSHDGRIFLYNVSSGSKTGVLSDWSLENMKIGSYHTHEQGITQQYSSKQFEGKITLFHVWDYVIDDIENIYLDDSSLNGNIFNWNLATLNVFGSTVKEIIDENQIRNLKPGLILLPIPTSFARAKIDCQRLGGKLTSFKTSGQILRVKDRFEKQSLCKGNVWSAYTKRANGLFLDDNNDTIEAENFHIGEPNGGRFEECSALYIPNGKHVDFGCKELLCAACDLQNWSKFRLRGKFSEFYKIDSDFYWIENQQFHFEGSMYNKLFGSKLGWNLLNLANETIFKLYNKEYPIGRYDWFEVSSNKTLSLSFDNCDDSQFNCGDGLCINKSKRCNQIKECSDNSDEENCSYISRPEDYNKYVPPFENFDGEYSITISNLSLKIENIRELENIFDINIRMVSKWRDSRIKFKDLHRNDKTILSKFDKERLWMPDYALWLTDKSGLIQDYSYQSVVAHPSETGNASDKTVSIAHTEYDGSTVDILLGNVKEKAVAQSFNCV